MKKMLASLLAAASVVVSAQTQPAAGEQKRAAWAIDSVKIEVSVANTPFFKIENEDRAVNMRLKEKDMNSAKYWLAVDVGFTVNAPQSARQWAKWLDGVEVQLDVFIPACDDNGNVGWGVLSGKQTLQSVHANGKRHFVRMMIPPNVLYRYFDFEGVSDYQKDAAKIGADLKKYAESLPVMATVTYGGRPVSGVQNCGRDIFSRLDKTQNNARASKFARDSSKLFYTILKSSEAEGAPTEATTKKLFLYISQNKFNPQAFKYMPDELLPVSKTPFAWVLFDRFETIKESASGN